MTEVAATSERYLRQLTDSRLQLHKNGAGQMLAYLKSRSNEEAKQVFEDLNKYLLEKLECDSDGDILEMLSNRDSAFHRGLALTAATAITELEARKGPTS